MKHLGTSNILRKTNVKGKNREDITTEPYVIFLKIAYKLRLKR